ncbi:MAG: ECF transporter S component, partial [Acidimicrobiia bacterium]|nr:ECF transporter S component [Acidimicrobiia bacterium]
FFLLILAGRVFGPGFGFAVGATTLFASGLLTGGVGPWLPFQMLAAAWVGLGAGVLPRASGRAEVGVLAAYGVVSSLLFGLAMNLSFWPFTLGPDTAVSFLPGAPIGENLRRFLLFDLTTSLGWDVGRSITTAVLVLIFGPSILRILRRAARRAAFDRPSAFHGPAQSTVASSESMSDPMSRSRRSADV